MLLHVAIQTAEVVLKTLIFPSVMPIMMLIAMLTPKAMLKTNGMAGPNKGEIVITKPAA